MKKKIKEALVTEQPGRKVVFSGLILSFLLGFFIRGLTQPEFLQSELKASVSRIHSTTHVDWGAASVSLKDGWWPRFSILIHDVKILSEETCWGQPLLYARELELPISLLSFFEKGQPLRKIYVRDSFLELKSGFVCRNKAGTIVSTKDAIKTQAIRLKPLREGPKTPPLVLTDFIFENLKLRQAGWAFPDWNFSTLELNVKENHPWFAEARATFSIPDMEGVDTGAQLVAVYKEFPSQVMEFKIKGHWREGAFQLNGAWEGAQKGWSYQSKFNHIPFQFLKTIANRTKTPWNWPDKPMWFSFSTQTVVPFTDWKASQHFVRQLEIEGDLGDLSIPDLEIKSWTPFKVQPFAFSIQQADLSAVFERSLKKVDFLSSFGKLSGQGQWSSEKDVLFTGKVEQVQIPLFHKDQKMTQVIQSMDLQAELKAGRWKMNSQKWALNKGVASGNFHLEGNQSLSTGQFQMSLDKLQVDPTVLKFMDVITPDVQLQGRLSAHWKKSSAFDFFAQVKTESIENPTLAMNKPVFSLKKTPSSWDLRIQSAQFRVKEFFFGAMDPEASSQLHFPYESKAMSAIFQWDLNRNLKWNLVSSSVRSSGTVDPAGGLKGTLSLGPRRHDKTLQMSGSRKSPQFLLLR